MKLATTIALASLAACAAAPRAAWFENGGDVASLRHWFDDNQGHPRAVLVLSPT